VKPAWTAGRSFGGGWKTRANEGRNDTREHAELNIRAAFVSRIRFREIRAMLCPE
jgi:hypothetical protein